MQVRKLFQALVIGGVALGAAHCGGGVDEGTQPSQVNTVTDAGTLPDGGTALPDGGTPDGGDAGGGGGPQSW